MGGSERWFQEVSERLAGDGHQVTVLITNAWDLEYFWDRSKASLPSPQEAHHGVCIRRLPVRHLPWSRILYPGTRRVMCWLGRGPRLGQQALFALGATTPWVPTLARELVRLTPPPRWSTPPPFPSTLCYTTLKDRHRPEGCPSS